MGAAFIVCTEVGDHYNTLQIPDFNIFHEKGTNKNGGVVIAVGKHLNATKVETTLQNTLIIDIIGLNEPIRVIGIYWPNSQQRNIQECLSSSNLSASELFRNFTSQTNHTNAC
ncbi:unnamed protein product [Rotaria socialis]